MTLRQQGLEQKDRYREKDGDDVEADKDTEEESKKWEPKYKRHQGAGMCRRRREANPVEPMGVVVDW